MTRHRPFDAMFPLLLVVLLALPGCGNNSPADPAPAASPNADAGPTGPVVPDTGVVVIHVRSRETIPSRLPADDTPMTEQEVRSAVHQQLVMMAGAHELGDALVCETLPGGRVRFWVARGDGRDDERATAMAEGYAEAFMQQAEERFTDRIDVALLGLGKELEAVSARRAEAQQSLRDYLEARRGSAETADSRREQAERERALSRVNDEAAELQQLIAELERLRTKGQPWYRRER